MPVYRHIPLDYTNSCHLTTLPPSNYPVSFPGPQQTKQHLTGKPNCNFPTWNLKRETELKMFVMFQAIKTSEKSGMGGIGGDRARPKITEKEPLFQSHHSKHKRSFEICRRGLERRRRTYSCRYFCISKEGSHGVYHSMLVDITPLTS